MARGSAMARRWCRVGQGSGGGEVPHVRRPGFGASRTATATGVGSPPSVYLGRARLSSAASQHSCTTAAHRDRSLGAFPTRKKVLPRIDSRSRKRVGSLRSRRKRSCRVVAPAAFAVPLNFVRDLCLPTAPRQPLLATTARDISLAFHSDSVFNLSRFVKEPYVSVYRYISAYVGAYRRTSQ